MISSLGFSQVELITNGTFDTTNNWALSGPGTNSIAGGVATFSSTSDTPGQPWDTQLVQGNLSFTSGASYTLTFKAKSLTAARTIKLDIQNVGDWYFQTPEQTFSLTTTLQTFTITFNAASTNTNVQVGFLMGVQGSTDGVVFDDVSLMGPAPVPVPVSAPPTVAATPPPARPTADVVSLYSDAYTSISPINYDAGWCGAGAVTATTAGSDNVLAYNGNPCEGITFPSDARNLTGFTNIHVDFFIDATTSIVGKVFNLKIVPTTGGGANDVVIPIDINALMPAPVPGTWYSFDYAFTSGDLANITAAPIMHEFAVTSNLSNAVWYDNLYIHKNTVLGTAKFETSNVKMYPNPVKNTLTIDANGSINKVSVYNILGQEVMKSSPKSNSVTLQTNELKKGVYMVTTDIDGKVSTSKVVKE